MGATIRGSKRAKLKALAKKRRANLEKRRKATKPVRDAINAKKRTHGHPGLQLPRLEEDPYWLRGSRQSRKARSW